MILTILGAAGGVVVFLGAAWAMVRSVVQQSSAVKDNTKALEHLTTTVEKLDDKLDNTVGRVTRLEARLEARRG